MKNSNLRFTDISVCMEEYNVYFGIIDKDSKGEKDDLTAVTTVTTLIQAIVILPLGNLSPCF